MNKLLIVLGTMIVVGFLFGSYVASLQSNEIKPSDYSTYLNKNAVQSKDGNVSLTLCDTIYEYSAKNDTVESIFNTQFEKDDKYGFQEVTSKGVMEGLAVLGLVALPTNRENAYNIMKSDWRYMVAGGVGLGLGFSGGFYLKYKGECDCEHTGFNTYLRDSKNLRLYTASLNAMKNKGVRIPINSAAAIGVSVDPSTVKGFVKE